MSYTADETYDVYCETERCAAKAHECDACREPISKGHRYYTVAWIFDGTATSIKRCLRCQALHKHLRTKGDADVWPRERLNCGQSYEDEWGPCPPEIAALAFKTGADLQ